MRLRRVPVLALAAAVLAGGCAARGDRHGRGPAATADRATMAAVRDGDSLSEYMAKVRHLSVAARPASPSALPTLETRDPDLAADLRSLAEVPSAAAHRRVAERYRRHGVMDAAYREYNEAVILNPQDGEAYEGLARIWRDWGMPELGLGDAHRAVYYTPTPSAYNTLGTIMQALGKYAAAKSAYAHARVLDPGAAYAVNNLCYLSFLEGQTSNAIGICRQALDLDPDLTAARNNLGLAYAAAGRMDLAQALFMDAADRGHGFYNTGIVRLASGDYRGALDAFYSASRANPLLDIARARAEQVRAVLRTLPDHP